VPLCQETVLRSNTEWPSVVVRGVEFVPGSPGRTFSRPICLSPSIGHALHGTTTVTQTQLEPGGESGRHDQEIWSEKLQLLDVDKFEPEPGQGPRFLALHVLVT
jgi:hypothetical protein